MRCLSWGIFFLFSPNEFYIEFRLKVSAMMYLLKVEEMLISRKIILSFFLSMLVCP